MRKLKTAVLFLLLFASPNLYAQQTDNRDILTLIKENSVRLGISERDAETAVISSAYVDPNTQLQYVYLQQTYQDVPVFNSIKTIVFKNRELAYSSGQFIQDIDARANQSTPALSASAAVINAAAHLGLNQPTQLNPVEEKESGKKIIFSSAGIAKQNIEVRLCWVVSHKKDEVRLAWNVNIDVLGSSDWWNVRVDARTGNILEKDNWTVYEATPDHRQHQAATDVLSDHATLPPPNVTSAGYYVVPFPFESPKHHALATEVQPWLKAGAGNPATTHGWHFDGTNNYTTTRGNNVSAYLDVANTNSPGGVFNYADTSTTPVPNLSFVRVPNFSQPPATVNNRKAAITNLFYWNNIIHDVTYQYGFNEVSGNFQADNLGRGGNANDYVQAEAQDASGTNNANFATPPDGLRPRMQMFLWLGGGPQVVVSAPASIAGNYNAVEGIFSAANQLSSTGAVTGQVVFYDDPGGTHEACSGAPTTSIAGKIALIYRGNCSFTDKVSAAQAAGAIGVIVVNNVAGAPFAMGGTDNSITIPAVMVSQIVGAVMISELANGVTATLAPPLALDADYDNGIVVHEYGHGISNRLTGGANNASCLNNIEQAGEGWSDYLALMLTTDWSTAQLTDGALARPMGNYSLNLPLTADGIRNFPYSTNMSVNPLTYAHMALSSESHFIGEIWCSALWDMTWNIIQQTGTIESNIYNSSSTAGNVVALKLVMEGMRLQPCNPGFLDARDAILAADSILYNGAHSCAIWKAFAKRGMGASALQGSSDDADDQVPAFDVPSSIYLSKSAAPSIMTQGTQQTFNISVTCQCDVPANSFTLRDTIPSGFSYVSSSGGVLSGNVVSFPGINFTSERETKTFSITIQADAAGCAIDSAINDDRTVTIGGLTSVSQTGTAQWNTSSLRSKSPSSSWRATTPGSASDYSLTSDPFTAGSLSILSFWHYHVIEKHYDGGTVELSANGGAWFDAGPYMIQNGYPTTMDNSAPWAPNQKAFSGVSYGQGSGEFINTVLDLSSFSGQTLRARFRMRSDVGNPASYEGWFVDDILQLNGCGGIIRAGLYNNSNTLIDQAAIPVFNGLNGPPTNILSQPADATVCAGGTAGFSVTANGGTLTYQWQVSTNGGANYSDIPGETSSTLTIPNVTAAMNGNLYRCVVNNGFNTATSTPGELILGQVTSAGTVANVTACEGSTAQMVSNASGSNLNYQWQVSTNGGTNYSDIPGATSANLQITSITLSQNGSLYRVQVTGACGTDVSTAATLTVNSAPSVSIINAPASPLCTTDDPVQLSASQSGGAWSGPGVSGNQFDPSGLTPAAYQVSYTITNAQGCDGVATAMIQVVSCADQQLPLDVAGAILIAPSPNDGRFSIIFKTELYSKLRMKMFASDGKLVHEQMITGITYGMIYDLSMYHLASGVYALSLYDDVSGKEKTFKIKIAR